MIKSSAVVSVLQVRSRFSDSKGQVIQVKMLVALAPKIKNLEHLHKSK